MSTEKKVLTIDRSNWYRGKGPIGSRLLTNGGKMCCLGFDAITCGLNPEEIRGKPVPKDLNSRWIGDPGLPQSHPYIQSRVLSSFGDNIVGRLVITNDNALLSESEREDKITTLFKQLGYDEVVFVN